MGTSGGKGGQLGQGLCSCPDSLGMLSPLRVTGFAQPSPTERAAGAGDRGLILWPWVEQDAEPRGYGGLGRKDSTAAPGSRLP